MDDETTEWMRKPRCGNEDKMYNDDIERTLIPQNLHEKEEKNQHLEICNDPQIDTMFYHPEDNSIYVFKGEHLWTNPEDWTGWNNTITQLRNSSRL